MLADAVTAQSLLLAIGGFVALLAVLLLWTWRRGQGRKTSAPGGGERWDQSPEGGRSVGGLLQTRIGDGVEASVEYSRFYEAQIVDEIAALDEGDHEEPGQLEEERSRMAELQATLQFLRAYRSDSARILGPGEEVGVFFAGLAAREESEQIPPVHGALLNLAESLKADSLLLAITTLDRYHGIFRETKVQDRMMQATTVALAGLAEMARRQKDKLKAPRPIRRQAVEEIERELKRVGNDLAGAGRSAPEAEGSRRPPELLFIQDRVRELTALARQEASELAERPDFQVELLEQRDSLVLESATLLLTFVVTDRRKIKQVSKVTVFPILDSKDLVYSSNPKTVELKDGRGLTEFMFRVLVFTAATFDPQPSIAFNIHYTFLGNEQRDVVTLKLPTLIPEPRIVNPFKEGTVGSGLAGKSQLFVGREHLLREVAGDLLQLDTAPRYYLIYGLTRTGKSSVLNQFAENPIWLKGQYLPIQVSAQSSQDTASFFQQLHSHVKDELESVLGHIKPVGDQPQSSPHWQRVTELLRQNAASMRKARKRILFLIDEYQKLATWDGFMQPDRQEFQTGYYQFPEFIKILRDQYGDLAAVLLAGSETLASLAQYKHYHWIQQLGGRVTTTEITNLAPPEADELILHGFEQNHLTIGRDLLARIRAYTACHPFLHMLMGSYLFEQMKTGNALRPDRVVRREDVDNAALKVEGEQMKFIWADPWIQGPGREESRIFLAALAAISYKHGSDEGDLTRVPRVSVDEVVDHLYGNFEIDPKRFRFVDAPAHLCAYGVTRLLEGPEGNRYQLTYPLFAIFAARQELLNQEIGNLRSQPEAVS